MNSLDIFQLALNLPTPWEVQSIQFEDQGTGHKVLLIEIGFTKGHQFEGGTTHDTRERKWRHLNFFEHECYIKCNVPRVRNLEGKVGFVQVPWARKNSGFTLLFEALSMALIENEMPINKAAGLVREYPQRLWNIFNYWISRAYNADNQSTVTRIGIDETSTKKGHNYITVLADIDQRRVLFATPGKDQNTIVKIKEHLEDKGVKPEQITDACIDMSPSFISGLANNFPQTAITFDKFHVVKLLNEAMDKVRKNEYKEHLILKGHKYTFLKSTKKLSPKQKSDREMLIELLPNIGKAYQLKMLFSDFWDFKHRDEAASFLSYWCDLVEEANIAPLNRFAQMIKSHWSGLINYIGAQIANGILEGINSKIQLAKRRARGYKNITNFINMVYFIAGKLKFDYPHYST
jgi:transposase